jgi:RNA ligase-like protein
VKEYQKIPGPFRRETEGPNRNRVIEGAWTSPELGYLAEADWLWTEKVDGTNIRVDWDGHRVSYGGRTDNAQIPAKLIAALNAIFAEELFEQQFGGDAVTLYGEGYGAGVQKGGVYRPDMGFVLFDVRVGNWWLRRDDVLKVAAGMGLDVAPLVFEGSIWKAIDVIRRGLPSVWNTEHRVEGIVGVTPDGLLSRSGHRLIVKVKSVDFYAPVSAALPPG